MTLKVGDKVRLLKQKGEGIVAEILENGKLAVTIDGFEFTYLTSEIVRIDEEDDRAVATSNVISKEDTTPIRKISQKHKKAEVWEIDLHLHEIQEDEKRYTHSEKLNRQLDYFANCLNEAIEKSQKRLVVIHGVGEGVLRAEVRNILKGYANIEFFDASMKEYGQGATEVVIH